MILLSFQAKLFNTLNQAGFFAENASKSSPYNNIKPYTLCFSFTETTHFSLAFQISLSLSAKMNSVSRLVLLSICLVLGIRETLAAQHSVTWDESTDFDSWAKANTFKVGDQLVFKYSPGLHSVVELSSEKEYSSCDVSNAVNSMSAGNDAVKLSKEGTRYFACGTPGHCGQGMKLKVKTVGANAAPSQDSSSKPTSTSASTSPVLKSVTSFVALIICTAFGFLNFV